MKPPILCGKKYNEPSVFTPESLLREARRQKSIQFKKVPEICLLDPDGDIVNNLLKENKAKLNPAWACYHTKLYDFIYNDIEFGIIGGAVGAPFAVLVAEELFVSGCQLLISISSAGQILPIRKPPYFVLIEKAIRDEGTSYHYIPPSPYSEINPSLLNILNKAFDNSNVSVEFGASWTTDAPFRETATLINFYRKANPPSFPPHAGGRKGGGKPQSVSEANSSKGVLAVEMEAAALYAFAKAKQKNVICFAHITNQMGKIEGDFEKGMSDGSVDALKVISITSKSWLNKT